jgi:hypothetical protein
MSPATAEVCVEATTVVVVLTGACGSRLEATLVLGQVPDVGPLSQELTS